jgi:hypothetical protein
MFLLAVAQWNPTERRWFAGAMRTCRGCYVIFTRIRLSASFDGPVNSME